MVFVTEWSEFVEQAMQLYCDAPERSRYVLKYRPSEPDIVLRVTDDRTVVQYKTNQQNHLKLIENWNLVMLKLTTTKNPDPATIAAEVEEELKAERERNTKKPAAKKGKQ